VEARLDGTPGRRRFGASQIGLAGVLASICRCAVLDRARLPHVYGLPVAADYRILSSSFGRARVPCGQAPCIGPFLLGLLAASGILLGKFVWGSNPTLCSALGLLIIASS
jgi:hypothetical protein